jgi:hypothetical protein
LSHHFETLLSTTQAMNNTHNKQSQRTQTARRCFER